MLAITGLTAGTNWWGNPWVPWDNIGYIFSYSKIHFFSSRSMLCTLASDQCDGYRLTLKTLYLTSKAISLGIGQI